MNREFELWQFVADHLEKGESVMLLIVATSSGSSPGRPSYKMAIAKSGEIIGSIGGGVMEVNLVDQSRAILVNAVSTTTGFSVHQVHRENVTNSSGMICSGKQTVIFKLLGPSESEQVAAAIKGVERRDGSFLSLTPDHFEVWPPKAGTPNEGGTQNIDIEFERRNDTDFEYRERLGAKHNLYIIGGGHCALALSEMMSKMDFNVSLFDDRPQLNTIEKNEYADEIRVIGGYGEIGEHIDSDPRGYAVVMTLGYKTDATVIRRLISKDFKYLGVLGSKAKMATLFRELIDEGYSKERLDLIRTPIGLPINSHSPEEIAVSIAAEIISIKNAA